jgi:hypothetical protein
MPEATREAKLATCFWDTIRAVFELWGSGILLGVGYAQTALIERGET